MTLKRYMLATLFAGMLHCQTVYCNSGAQTFLTTGTFQYNNLTNQCSRFTFTYQAEQFSALTISMDGAQDNGGSPGSWAAIANSGSCTVTGVNPDSTTTSDTIVLSGCYFPWIRINLSSVTGTGSVTARFYGSASATAGGSGGGGFGTGATYYVATTGSDNNPCSSTLPCATVNHVAGIIPAAVNGTYTVNIANGTYAQGMCIYGYVMTGNGAIKIVGNDGSPSSVVFTGACSLPSILGSETTGILITGNAGGVVVIDGVKITPSTLANWGVFCSHSNQCSLKNIIIGGSINEGFGCFVNTNCSIDTSINVSGYTNSLLAPQGAGLHVGANSFLANQNNAAMTILPATGGNFLAGIYAEQNSGVDFEGTGTITYNCNTPSTGCYGIIADLHASIYITQPLTFNNASTPGNSYLIVGNRSSSVVITGPNAFTATNWTSGCLGARVSWGQIDTRTFTSVGASGTNNGGFCSF